MRVIVIGAGLAGLCSAYSLQRAGCDVIVIDRRHDAGLETSYANGGLMTPSMSQPWNAPGIHRALLASIGRSDSPILLRPGAVLKMGTWGLGFLRESCPRNYVRNALRNFRLAKYSIRVIDEIYGAPAAAATLRRSGSINLYRHSRELEAGDRESRTLGTEGLRHSLLSPQECTAIEPLLAPIEQQLAGGISFPDDRSGDAYAFCRSLASAIASGGGKMMYAIQALTWDIAGTRVRALQTSTGPMEADCFVIAAGSYSRGLARRLGIALPIFPAKGYSLSIRRDQLPALPRVPVVDSSLHAAITPIDGVLRIAGTAEFAGFDDRVAADRIRNLESLFARIYPELAARDAGAEGTTWAGLRPMTVDGVPIIGATRVENVFVNAGHGHLGWTLAAGSGELLAQLVTGASPMLDPADYASGRRRS